MQRGKNHLQQPLSTRSLGYKYARKCVCGQSFRPGPRWARATHLFQIASCIWWCKEKIGRRRKGEEEGRRKRGKVEETTPSHMHKGIQLVVSLTNPFADKTILWQGILLTSRQTNATGVDAVVILSSSQRIVLSAKCLFSELVEITAT